MTGNLSERVTEMLRNVFESEREELRQQALAKVGTIVRIVDRGAVLFEIVEVIPLDSAFAAKIELRALGSGRHVTCPLAALQPISPLEALALEAEEQSGSA